MSSKGERGETQSRGVSEAVRDGEEMKRREEREAIRRTFCSISSLIKTRFGCVSRAHSAVR